MILREIINQLSSEDSPAIYEELSFRDKDLHILKGECSFKYRSFAELAKQVLAPLS